MPPASIILISAPPTTVTLEEHQQLVQSTPASFSEIPPVLRLRQDDVSIEFEPAVEDITAEELSKGTLYITESTLAFIASSTGKGFNVLYPSITIHAASRSNTRPMVYCQIEQVQDGDEDGDENAELLELKIFPQNPTKIDDVFEALSYCASLHPDPNLDMDDGDDDVFYDGEFQPFTGEDDEELSEVGRAALEHLESVIEYRPSVQRPDSPAADASNTKEGLASKVNGR